MEHPRVQELVKELELAPHPEGGYFKEVYRSNEKIAQHALPGYSGDRNIATSIYFLLTKDNFSAFHNIKQDELWHHYEGDPVEVHTLDQTYGHQVITLGKNLTKGEQFQGVAYGGQTFGSRVKAGGEYALVGCTVAPGFDFDDFILSDRNELLGEFPQHEQIIHALTRS